MMGCCRRELREVGNGDSGHGCRRGKLGGGSSWTAREVQRRSSWTAMEARPWDFLDGEGCVATSWTVSMRGCLLDGQLAVPSPNGTSSQAAGGRVPRRPPPPPLPVASPPPPRGTGGRQRHLSTARPPQQLSGALHLSRTLSTSPRHRRPAAPPSGGAARPSRLEAASTRAQHGLTGVRNGEPIR